MPHKLDAIERRVLGALMEKALAQPAYYPMTLNAVTAACNQKSNRDPEMNLDEEAVYDALERLRGRGLMIRASTAGGRTDRFRHLANEVFGWDSRQRAIMTELMLRGPQTVGELRTRASRMSAFDSLEMVSAVLDSLSRTDPPYVAQMPRSVGHSAVRFTHLLYPDGEAPPALPSEAAAPIPTAMSAGAMSSAVTSAARPDEVAGLRTELENAQTEIAELQEAIAELRRRVETLEGR